jgi:hypothetical protein
MDYTALSLTDVRSGLDETAREAQAVFGVLDARQLNWRPGEARWSVAQCLEHLLSANRLMMRAADEALLGKRPSTIWQRLPGVPGILGRTLIRSQAPTAMRKFKAPSSARPAASDIAPDVVQRFVDQHRDAVARAASLDERRAAAAIMTSPFAKVITYSVLDGWRLMFAHDRRHFEQARRVMALPEFPGAGADRQ